MGSVRKELKIKFCGLRTVSDVEAVNEIRPDYAGFVLASGRKRTITGEEAKTLKSRLLPEISSVGVFVDEEPERIAALYRDGTFDLAQLHGKEDEAYIRRLRSLVPDLVLIRAFVIRSMEDVREAEESSADLLLLDSGTGSGKTFDLSLVRDFRRPFILAGGLSAENAEERIRNAPESLLGLDVSSGIETDGVKDPGKMREFIKIVRNTIKDGNAESTLRKENAG